MWRYIATRLLLIAPTLFGIMIVNFAIVQFIPGGPVEQALLKLETNQYALSLDMAHVTRQQPNTSQHLPQEVIDQITAQYGFDKPAHIRFWLMLKNYVFFNFGDSYYRDASVLSLIAEKLPTSISLGLWSTLLIYLISIPLGIKKALHHKSPFDIWTSTLIVVAYAIPGFLFAVILIVIFAGGSYLDWLPLRGLTSDHFHTLSPISKIKDYIWHLILPLTAYTLGGFATLTLLTKNSFLDEVNKHYVTTAIAKGLNDRQVLYGHVFRNSMLIIIASFPTAVVSMFFTGSLLIEVIFSLDGIGLLSYEAIINRDYPIVFSTLYIFTLISLILKLLSDLIYHWVDPRIHFESRK